MSARAVHSRTKACRRPGQPCLQRWVGECTIESQNTGLVVCVGYHPSAIAGWAASANERWVGGGSLRARSRDPEILEWTVFQPEARFLSADRSGSINELRQEQAHTHSTAPHNYSGPPLEFRLASFRAIDEEVKVSTACPTSPNLQRGPARHPRQRHTDHADHWYIVQATVEE